MTSTHILVKEIDPEDPEGFRYRIECQVPDSCDGWIECDKPSEFGCRYADSPYDCPDDAPWSGLNEFEFHGVPHTWRDGYGWTVPFEGCIVAWADWEPPDEVETLPPGRYQVEDDWDDTSLYLNYVGPEEVSP
jgi:hypothetical protein